MPNELDRERAAHRLVDEQLAAIARRTDQMFAWLLVVEWIAAAAAAFGLLPREGDAVPHGRGLDVVAAVVQAGAMVALPVYLAVFHPGKVITRHAIAIAQAGWPVLLSHFAQGRFETQFCVFGCLASLA